MRVLVIQHESAVDLALLAGRLGKAEAQVDIVGPAREREIPASLDGYDGLIVLGGSMDPVDDMGAPWLPAVRDLLRPAASEQVPTLGVCLGAQLLGMAIGGTARHVPAGPECGVNVIRPTGAAAGDPLLGALPLAGRRSLAWHTWEVTDLPADLGGHPIQILAESDECPVHAFVVGAAVWGLQFHLEATDDSVRAWVAAFPPSALNSPVDPAELIEELAASREELVANWTPVMDAWIDVVRRHAHSGRDARDAERAGSVGAS